MEAALLFAGSLCALLLVARYAAIAAARDITADMGDALLPLSVFLAGWAASALTGCAFPWAYATDALLPLLALTAAADGAVISGAAAAAAAALGVGGSGSLQGACMLAMAAAGALVGAPARYCPPLRAVFYAAALVLALLVSEASVSAAVSAPVSATAASLLRLPALRAAAASFRALAAAVGEQLAAGAPLAAAVAVLGALPPPAVSALSEACPPLSLAWYAHGVSLSRFLPYGAVLAAAQPLLYVAPLAWRLRRRIDLAALAAAGAAALLDAGGGWTLARFPQLAALALAHRGVIARMRGAPVALAAGFLFAATAAAPAMHHAWVSMGTGNANLLFNLCLVVAVAGGALIAEFTGAALRVQALQGREDARAERGREKGATG